MLHIIFLYSLETYITSFISHVLSCENKLVFLLTDLLMVNFNKGQYYCNTEKIGVVLLNYLVKIDACYVSKPDCQKYLQWQFTFIYNVLVLVQGVKMTSRYNQEYFFQHSGWWMYHSQIWITLSIRIQKRFLNLRHFASVMFTNGCYWNDADKIRHDLEIECRNSDCVFTYLSYISMMKASYNLNSRGFFIFTIDFTSYSYFFLSICKCNV